MTDERPLTQYRQDIARTGGTNTLREGIVTPDEAEETGQTMNLKEPQAPIIVRFLGRVAPIW
jgi:hypothetical protein